MRWTPLADQMLLLKLIETHEINIDTAKVAAAWPTDLGGEAPPTARAIKERLSKIRELIKQSASSTSISAPSGKRGRIKKNTSTKSTSGTKVPGRPRMAKQQSTAAVNPEQPTLDAANHDYELDELLSNTHYKTQAPDIELTDIPEYSAQATAAEEEVPTLHDNPDEFDVEA